MTSMLEVHSVVPALSFPAPIPIPCTPRRFAQFLGLVTLESFTSSALGLALGSLSPTTEAALALGPSVMVLFIVFGERAPRPDRASPRRSNLMVGSDYRKTGSSWLKITKLG